MGMKFCNLTPEVRRFIVDEINMDEANATLYKSRFLTEQGNYKYLTMLLGAAATHDDEWLTGKLRRPGIFLERAPRRTSSGGMATAQVPITAPETLSEGEFNRFYARGVCRYAIAHGIASVIVYRAKQVEHPPAEAEQKIGLAIDATQLLADLRKHPGTNTAFGIPAGPNSGLSVMLPT